MEHFKNMSKIISVANQKGGVGKTTTAINLSSCLAEKGKKVLLIDIDPQGNATTGLGLDKKTVEHNTYTLLIGESEIIDCIKHTDYAGLDIIPSSVDLAGAEIELLDVNRREYTLKKAVDTIRDDYDYIVIDCPPSLSLLTVNAMTTADAVMIVIQCEFFAMEGLTQLMDIVNLVRRKLSPYLEVDGIVFTMYDSRTNLSQQVVEEVKEYATKKMPGTHIYNAIIPRNVRLSEAPSFGQPINVYDSRCAGTESYRNLAAEFITNEV